MCSDLPKILISPSCSNSLDENMIPKRGDLDGLNMSLVYREADLNNAVVRSLHLAKNEYRLRIGLKTSLKLLECDPKSVVMAVLPVSNHKDSLSHVQLMLIEAFCNENGIRLLQVHGSEKLMSDVTSVADADAEEDKEESDDDVDISLILIQAASQKISYADSELQKLYDMACQHYSARPIIYLPS